MATLTAENLVGYLRAEYKKSSRYRIIQFLLQFTVTIPVAIAVLVPDTSPVTLYVLAAISLFLAALWWWANGKYLEARAAAQAARRASLLLGGLQEPFSPNEIESLRGYFTVNSDEASRCEKPDYYASHRARGSARLGEMLEESAFYSEALHRKSASVMQIVLVLYAVAFVLIALLAPTMLENHTTIIFVRVFLALAVFAFSSDVLGAYRAHRSAAQDAQKILHRLRVADRDDYPFADVLLAMCDYNAAVEGAPEIVPYVYDHDVKRLNKRWSDYQSDRETRRKADGEKKRSQR